MLTRFKHVEISKTEEYLNTNGKSSLPDNFYEMIFFDLKLTFKEFIIDLFYTFLYFFREFGLLIFAIFYLIYKSIKDPNSYNGPNTNLIYIFSAAYIIFINFIVITNIQMRWFMFFIPALLSIAIMDLKKYKYSNILLSINNIILIIMHLRTIIDIQ